LKKLFFCTEIGKIINFGDLGNQTPSEQCDLRRSDRFLEGYKIIQTIFKIKSKITLISECHKLYKLRGNS